MPKVEIEPYDAALFLDSEEMIAAYLHQAFEEGDPEMITVALGNVARAKGMTEVAQEAGVTRPALYRALSQDGNPHLDTLLGVMKSLGFKLDAVPA